MGWDAISSVGKRMCVLSEFKNAEKDVIYKTGHCDGALHIGCLDCKECGEMLEIATGESVYIYWSESKVKKLNSKANWDFQYNKEDAYAYWSARYFLAVCAKNELSISFSW
jgi:hypothetical protein